MINNTALKFHAIPTFLNYIFNQLCIASLLILLFVSAGISQSITFNNQQDIDNFSTTYPGLNEVEYLTINGSDIINLEGLSQLVKIKVRLTIYSTSLVDLAGLDNLISLNENDVDDLHLSIFDNPQLETLEALDNVEYDFEFGTIVIIDNPNLTVCNVNFICSHLTKHRPFLVWRNGENCSQYNEITSACTIEYELDDKSLIYSTGFENWGNLHPEGFQVLFIEQGDVIAHVLNKVEALTEGESAMSLTNDYIIIDEHLPVYIVSPIPSTEENVNIEFDCKCKGEGLCEIFILESNASDEITGFRPLWTIQSSDTSLYHIQFSEVAHSSSSQKIGGIGFKVSSETSFPTTVAEFILDDLKIYAAQPTSTLDLNNEPKIYPNPTSSFMTIDGVESTSILRVYNARGELVLQKMNDSPIDLSGYAKGVYYIKVSNENSNSSYKIIKQ